MRQFFVDNKNKEFVALHKFLKRGNKRSQTSLLRPHELILKMTPLEKSKQ